MKLKHLKKKDNPELVLTSVKLYNPILKRNQWTRTYIKRENHYSDNKELLERGIK